MAKGESATEISFDDLLAREVATVNQICEMGLIGEGVFDTETVAHHLRKAENVWGELTEHYRFIPGGLDLPELYQVLYQLDDWSEGNSFLYDTRGEEWWRTDDKIEHIPTDLGVLDCNLTTANYMTGMDGAPYNLNLNQQENWARQQGGDRLMSAEEILYLFVRSIKERSLPLWAFGSARCRDTSGLDCSLYVRWNAGEGLHVGYWGVDAQHPSLGALARKFCKL